MADRDVLDCLRRMDERISVQLDRSEFRQREIIKRLDRLEREVARLHGNVSGLHADYAGVQSRLDNVNLRIDRIERSRDLGDGTLKADD
jgi:hypothetical protein